MAESGMTPEIPQQPELPKAIRETFVGVDTPFNQRFHTAGVITTENCDVLLSDMHPDLASASQDEKNLAIFNDLQKITDEAGNPVSQLTAREIAELPKELQYHLDSLGLSGILLNVTGKRSYGGQYDMSTSAIAAVACMEKLVEIKGDTDATTALKQVVEHVHHILSRRNVMNVANKKILEQGIAEMGIVLVKKDGSTVSFNTHDQEIVQVDADGNAEKKGKEGVIALGMQKDGQPVELDFDKSIRERTAAAAKGTIMVGPRVLDKLQKADDGVRKSGVKSMGEFLVSKDTGEGTVSNVGAEIIVPQKLGSKSLDEVPKSQEPGSKTIKIPYTQFQEMQQKAQERKGASPHVTSTSEEDRVPEQPEPVEVTKPVASVEQQPTPPQPPRSSEPPSTPEKRGKSHKVPYYADNKNSEPLPLDGIESRLSRTLTVTKPDGTEETITYNYWDEVTKIVHAVDPNFDNLSTDQQIAVLSQVEERARYSGDYRGVQDVIFSQVRTYPHGDVLLMAIEARKLKLMQAANKPTRGASESEAAAYERRQIRTAVDHSANVSEVAGGLQSYFEGVTGERIPRTEQRRDLLAFTFIGDELMQMPDPALGKNSEGKVYTYKEKFEELQTSGAPDANRRLLELRRDFYRNAIDALKKQGAPVGTSEPTSPQEQVQRAMQVRIQTLAHELSQATTDEQRNTLVDRYTQLTSDKGLRADNRQELLDLFANAETSGIMDGALKGAEFMYRRSLMDDAPIRYPQVPNVIYKKQKVEFAQSLEEAAQGIGLEARTADATMGDVEVPATPTPDPATLGEVPATLPDQATGEAVAPVIGEGEDGLDAAPVSVTSEAVAPSVEAPRTEGAKIPQVVVLALAANNQLLDHSAEIGGYLRDSKVPDITAVTPPTDDLPPWWQVGARRRYRRALERVEQSKQEVNPPTGERPTVKRSLNPFKWRKWHQEAEVRRQYDVHQRNYTNARKRRDRAGGPHSLLARATLPFKHPVEFVKNTWQSNLNREAFHLRESSFALQATQVAQDALGLDPSVTLQISPETFTEILQKGDAFYRSQRDPGFVKRTGYNFMGFDRQKGLGGTLRSVVTSVTGAGKTIEQKGAIEWLKTAEGRLYLRDVVLPSSLREQDSLGRKYAIVAERTDGKQLTDAEFQDAVLQANEQVISEVKGETREYIDMNTVGTDFDQVVKDLITSYAQAEFNESAPGDKALHQSKLLSDFNRQLRLRMVDNRELQKKLQGTDLASNIISLAETVRTNYKQGDHDAVLKQVAEMQIRMVAGHAEWGGARGNVDELGPIPFSLKRSLLNRMAARNYGKERHTPAIEGSPMASALTYAVSYAKDFGVYAGVYGSAWGIATGKLFGLPMLQRMAVIPATGAIVAGLKEGGLNKRVGEALYGIAGNKMHEFTRYSKERAKGRIDPDGALVRKEFEAALVGSKTVEDLLSPVTNLVTRQGELNRDEKRTLALYLADIQSRLTMTDLTTTRKGLKIALPQNFITYREGQENEQVLALRKALVQGTGKLGDSEHLNIYKTATLIMHAHLRHGDQLKNAIITKVQAEARQKGITVSIDQIREIEEQLSRPEMNLGIPPEKSLNRAMKNLAKLNNRATLKAGASTAVGSFVFGFGMHALAEVGERAVGAVAPVMIDQVTDLQQIVDQGVRDAGEQATPLTKFASVSEEMGKRIGGEAVTGTEQAVDTTTQAFAHLKDVFVDHQGWTQIEDGKVVGTLTPIEKAVLRTVAYAREDLNWTIDHIPNWVKGKLAIPENAPDFHTVQIDDVTMQLPEHLQFDEVGNHKAFIDVRTGEIYDLSNVTLTAQDNQLMVNTGQETIPAATYFANRDVPFEVNQLLPASPEVGYIAEQLHGAGMKDVELKIPDPFNPDNPELDYVTRTRIPANTEWQVDREGFSASLVMTGENGEQIKLLDNVQIRNPNAAEMIYSISTYEVHPLLKGHEDIIQVINQKIGEEQYETGEYVEKPPGHAAMIPPEQQVPVVVPETVTHTVISPEYQHLTLPQITEKAIGELSSRFEHTIGWTNETPYSDHNELKFFNSTTQLENGLHSVTLDGNGVGMAYEPDTTAVPVLEEMNVTQLAADDKLSFAFQFGDHMDEPILVKAHHGLLTLDPTNNAEYLYRPDGQPLELFGHKVTVGEFSRLILNQDALEHEPTGSLNTELNDKENVFNLRVNDQNGRIRVAYVDERNPSTVHYFNAITGAGELEPQVLEQSLLTSEVTTVPDGVQPGGVTVPIPPEYEPILRSRDVLLSEVAFDTSGIAGEPTFRLTIDADRDPFVTPTLVIPTIPHMDIELEDLSFMPIPIFVRRDMEQGRAPGTTALDSNVQRLAGPGVIAAAAVEAAKKKEEEEKKKKETPKTQEAAQTTEADKKKEEERKVAEAKKAAEEKKKKEAEKELEKNPRKQQYENFIRQNFAQKDAILQQVDKDLVKVANNKDTFSAIDFQKRWGVDPHFVKEMKRTNKLDELLRVLLRKDWAGKELSAEAMIEVIETLPPEDRKVIDNIDAWSKEKGDNEKLLGKLNSTINVEMRKQATAKQQPLSVEEIQTITESKWQELMDGQSTPFTIDDYFVYRKVLAMIETRQGQYITEEKMKEKLVELAKWDEEAAQTTPTTTSTEDEKKKKEAAAQKIAKDLDQKRQEFRQKFETGNAEGVLRAQVFSPNLTSIFQQVDVHKGLSKGSDDMYRGYVLVPPGDIPRALDILWEKAQARRTQDKGTVFKWRMGYRPDTTDYSDLTNLEQYTGRYDEREPGDAQIVIYGDTAADVQEVLGMLAEDARWEELEQHRLAEGPHRRPGTEAYKQADKEYRSLNYGVDKGYSEDQARNALWRFERESALTQRITHPSREAEVAEQRLRELYDVNKQILVRGRQLYREQLKKIARALPAGEPLRTTDADLNSFITTLQQDTQFKPHIDTIKTKYGVTDEATALQQFIQDMNLMDIAEVQYKSPENPTS